MTNGDVTPTAQRRAGTIHLVSSYLFYGGAEKQFRYLASTIENAGFAFILHVMWRSDSPEAQAYTRSLGKGTSVELRTYGWDPFAGAILSRLSALPRRLFWLWRAIDRRSVVYLYSSLYLPLIPLLRLKRCRVAFSERILSSRVRKRRLLYQLTRLADVFMVNSTEQVRFFRAHGLAPQMLPNVVEPTPRLRSPSGGTDAVAIIARYDPPKNIDFAIESLRDMSITLNVYGEIQNAAYYRSLSELAKKAQLDVRLHGPCPLGAIYAENRLILIPSRAEGTSNVLIEAMVNSFPVLASDICANRQTGVHRESLAGFDEDWAKRVEEMLSWPAQQIGPVLDHNRRTAVRRYSLPAFNSRITRLFTELGAAPHPSKRG